MKLPRGFKELRGCLFWW